jgi:hypothetical protein
MNSAIPLPTQLTTVAHFPCRHDIMTWRIVPHVDNMFALIWQLFDELHKSGKRTIPTRTFA